MRKRYDWILGCACLIAVIGQAESAAHLIAVPDHANDIYAVNETVGWTIEAADPQGAYEYFYTARENDDKVIQTGHIDLRSGKARIELRLSEPGMVLIKVDEENSVIPRHAEEDEHNTKKRASHALLLGAAVSPTSLIPDALKPSDFDSFWNEKLAELAKVPMESSLTPVSGEWKGARVYKVKLDSVGSHVQGYLARPAAPGKHPALVIYQWAGVYRLNPRDAALRAENGWLTFNVDSHDMDPAADKGVSTEYYKIGDHDRESSYFLDMYLRDTRALDYIASLPDWDGKTIVLMGTSMGGQQSLVTAGLNPYRVTAVIVNEPSGADTNGNLHNREAGYPYWDSASPEAMKTALYFDPVNFAPRIRAATLIGVGFLDETAPPAGLWTVYNLLQSPKEIVPMLESAHNNVTPEKQGNFLARQKEVLAALLHGAQLDLKGINSAAVPERGSEQPK